MSLTVLVTNPTPDLYGASRMALESITGFRERGWEVVASFPSRGPLVEAAETVGASVRTTPSPVLRKQYLTPIGLAQLAWQVARAVPATVELLRTVRPDVVYVNTITEPLWLVVGAVLRIPVVCHVHEAETGIPALAQRALTAPLLLARSVVCNSRFSRDVAVRSWPRLAGRAVVVHNGVAGPPERRPARRSIEGSVRLLYAGRLSERKGVPDVVEAVGALQRRGVAATLDVVGGIFPGYEWVERDLRSRVRQLRVGDRVRFHGFDPDVWPHLADADVLVVPSRLDEPFGNTAVEGLLAGRPVVATTTGGLREAVDGYTTVEIVPPADPEAIADAVVRIVDRWATIPTDADQDAARAAERHAPSRYRADVAEVVGAAAG